MDAMTVQNDLPGWLKIWLGGEQSSTSGVTVNASTALTYTSVWQAISTISGDVSGLPLNVYRRKADGSREADYTHDAYWMLNEQANDWMTADVVREVLMAHCLMFGNGYARIIRRRGGALEGLQPLMPDWTKPEVVEGRVIYKARLEEVGPEYEFEPSDILHIKGLGYDGLTGYSVVSMARNAWGLGMAQERHGATHFKNNARPTVLLKHPGKIEQEKADALLDDWHKRHADSEGAQKTGLLSGGLDVMMVPPANNDDSQWLASREFSREEVAGWFRMPPSKLGSAAKVSYNSLEVDERAYINMTLRPWFVRWHQECKAKLLTETERRNRWFFFEHDYSHLIEADIKTKYEAMAILRQNGIMSPNEARAKLNMPPRDDPGGDSYDNPNTTPGGQAPPAEPPAEAPPDQTTENVLRDLISDKARYMLNLEGKRLQDAAGKDANFVQWVESFYSSWSSRWAEALQPFLVHCNGDRSSEHIAAEITDQSKTLVLNVAGYSYPDTITDNVRQTVEAWATTRPVAIAEMILGGSHEE